MNEKVLNAYRSVDYLVVLSRAEDGRTLERRQRAEFSFFLKRDDFRKVEPDIRASERKGRILRVREEGEFVRVLCRDDDFRRRLWLGHEGSGGGYFEALGIEAFEIDVHPASRFLVDSGCEIAKPRAGCLDLETDSRVPFARKEQARILCWNLAREDGERYGGMLEEDTDEAELELLRDLFYELGHAEQVRCWNGKKFDEPVLRARARRYGIRVEWGRWLFLDQMECFRKYNAHSAKSGGEKESVALERVAESLGIDTAAKTKVDASKSWDYWVAGGEQRQLLFERNAFDAASMLEIEKRTGYCDLHYAVCATSGCLPDTRALNALVHVEAFVLRVAAARGMRLPTKRAFGTEKDLAYEQFKGAFVLEPNIGMHFGVHVCDFAGMYPTIIETLNISPEMLVPELAGKPEETYHDVAKRLPPNHCVAPRTKAVFRTDELGILPLVIRTLKETRKSYNDARDAAVPDSPEWHEADRLSQGCKIAVNSCFGVLSSKFFRWYERAVGESITTTGAWLIEAVIEKGVRERQMIPVGSDSVAADRVLVLKDPNGDVRLLRAEDLWDNIALETSTRFDGKEEVVPVGWFALAKGEASGWFPLKRTIRHRAGKEMWKISTKHGQTEITEDHGIMCEGRATRPSEFVDRRLAFERVDPPIEVPLLRIDLIEYLKGLGRVVTGQRTSPYVLKFVPEGEDWIRLEGKGERGGLLLRRYYEAGSSEMAALLRAIAAYASDGSACLKPESCRYMLSFCKGERRNVEEVAEALNVLVPGLKIFGPYWTANNWVVRSGTRLLACLFATLCGQGSKRKRCPPFVYRLGEEDRERFIGWCADGDGYRRKDGSFASFTTTSPELAAGISYLFSQHGISHGFGWRVEKGAWKIYTRKSPTEIAQYKVHVERRVSSPDEWVYDLEVEGAHTFVDGVGRVLLHNTDSFLAKNTNSTSFREFVRECNAELFPALLRDLRCQKSELKLEYEKSYAIQVVTGKKRYAARLLEYKGKPPKELTAQVRGLEYVRGDQLRIAREFQHRVVKRLLLLDGEITPTVPSPYPLGPEAFHDLVTAWKARVLEEPLTLRDVVVSQSLKGPPESYERGTKADGQPMPVPIHVAVARILEERGADVSEGARVEYVVVDGDATPIRAVPAADYRPGMEDRAYLWESKVWPPTRRLLAAAFPDHNWGRFDEGKDRGGGRGKSAYLPGQFHFSWWDA